MVDVQKFYLANLISQTSNSSSGEVTGASVAVTTEPNTAWLVRNVTARFDYVATFNSTDNQHRLSIQYLQSTNATLSHILAFDQFLLAAFGTLALAATYSRILTFTPSEPYWIPSGSVIQCSSSSNATAGSYNISLRVDLAAIPL
jgi:ethanolamine utilization protein EutQ (cupin superfamily)